MPAVSTRRKSGAVVSRTLPIAAVRGEVLESDVKEAALEAEGRVKQALQDGKSALWHLYEALYDFDQRRGWEALGHENVSQWLVDPSIEMTRGSYYRGVNTWRRWVVEGGVKPAQLEQVSATKAALLDVEVASGSVTAAAAIKDVQALPASKLREKYEKPQRGRPKQGVPGRGVPVTTRQPAALREAADLPWDFIEEALHSTGPMNLREARLRTVLEALLDWRGRHLA